jgi:hypothetical protein
MAEVKKDVVKQVSKLLNLFFVNYGGEIKLERLCLASFFRVGFIFARKARSFSSIRVAGFTRKYKGNSKPCK